MTGAAGFTCDAVVTRIGKADELGTLQVEQAISAFRRGAGRIAPSLRIKRVDVCFIQHSGIFRAALRHILRAQCRYVAAVAIRAAQCHCGVNVHGGGVGFVVTAQTACAFVIRLRLRLLRRSRWGKGISLFVNRARFINGCRKYDWRK